MNNPEKIIDRIRKLLALAASANEHEAAVAAEKAQEMLAEYNLTLSDVEQQEEGLTEGALASDSRPWRRLIAANVARLYFCEYYFQFQKEPVSSRKCGYVRWDVHVFVGAPHNVEIAKSIFHYLCEATMRVALIESNKRKREGRTEFYTSFLHGCAKRLAQRLTAKWAMVMDPPPMVGHEQSQLPALYRKTQAQLDAYMDKYHGGTTQITEHNPKLHSLEGAIAGFKAAEAIGLDVQVKGQNKGVMLENRNAVQEK